MKPIVSRDPQRFLDRIAVEHGDQVAEAAAFTMLPLEERVRVLEARRGEIRARLDDLVTEHPGLKSLSGGF